MVSFECNNERDNIMIHFDEIGADFLIELIMNLKKSNINEHSHLMSEEWGGGELTIIKDTEDIPIHHVKIYFWKENPF